jgi:tol-pal system protein YbgF
MRRFCGVLVIGSLIGLLGCSGALMPSRATDRDDLSELKRRVLELQEQAAVTQIELDRVRRVLAELQEGPTVSQRSAATPEESASETVLDSLNQGNPTNAPVQSVTAATMLESSDLEPQRIESPEALGTEAEGIEEQGEDEAVQGKLLEGEESTSEVDLEPVSPEAQFLYDRGYTLYHQARYIDAESGFRRFLQTYPRNELADNAQYWIGESRYARGDIRGALAAFQETVERYPEGNKVPDAILKLAGCLEELGASEAAQARYDEVLRRFPNTAAAVLAEERRQDSE